MARLELTLPTDHPTLGQNDSPAGTAAGPADREPYERHPWEIVTMGDGTLVMPALMKNSSGAKRWYFFQKTVTGTGWSTSGTYAPPDILHHAIYDRAAWGQSKPFFGTDPYDQHLNTLVFLSYYPHATSPTVRTLQLDYGQVSYAHYFPTQTSFSITTGTGAVLPGSPYRAHSPFQAPTAIAPASEDYPILHIEQETVGGDLTRKLKFYRSKLHGDSSESNNARLFRGDLLSPQPAVLTAGQSPFNYTGTYDGGWFCQTGTNRHFGPAAGPSGSGEAIAVRETVYTWTMFGYEDHATRATSGNARFRIRISRYAWHATQQPSYADNTGQRILYLTDSTYFRLGSGVYTYDPFLGLGGDQVLAPDGIMAYDGVSIHSTGGGHPRMVFGYFSPDDAAHTDGTLQLEMISIAPNGGRERTKSGGTGSATPGSVPLRQLRLGYKPASRDVIIIGAAAATDAQGRPEVWYRTWNLLSDNLTGWERLDTTSWGTDVPSSNIWLSKYVYGNCIYVGLARHDGTAPYEAETLYVYDIDLPGRPQVGWHPDISLYADRAADIPLAYTATDPDQGDNITGYRICKTVGSSTYSYVSAQAGWATTANTVTTYGAPDAAYDPAQVSWLTTGRTDGLAAHVGTVTTGTGWVTDYPEPDGNPPQTFYIQVRDQLSTPSDWATVTVVPDYAPTVTIDTPTALSTVDDTDIIEVSWTATRQAYWQIRAAPTRDLENIMVDTGRRESSDTADYTIPIEDLDGNADYRITLTVWSERLVAKTVTVTVTVDLPELVPPTVVAVPHPDGEAVDLYTHTLVGYDYHNSPAPTPEAVTVTVDDRTADVDHAYPPRHTPPVVREPPNLTVDGWDTPTINKTTDWLVRSGSHNVYKARATGRSADGTFAVGTEGPPTDWYYRQLLDEGQNGAVYDVSAGGTRLDGGLPTLINPSVFQDTEMTIPATRPNDPVRAIKDLSGNGYHGTFADYLQVPPSLQYSFEGPSPATSDARGVPPEVSGAWSVDSLSGMRVSEFLANAYSNLFLYAVAAWDLEQWISPIGIAFPWPGAPDHQNGIRRAYQLMFRLALAENAWEVAGAAVWRELLSTGYWSTTWGNRLVQGGSDFSQWCQDRTGDNYIWYAPTPALVGFTLRRRQYTLDEYTFRISSSALNGISNTVNTAGQRWNLHILGMDYMWNNLRVQYPAQFASRSRFYKAVIAGDTAGNDVFGDPGYRAGDFGGLSDRQRSWLNAIYSRAVRWDRQVRPLTIIGSTAPEAHTQPYNSTI